MFVTFASVGMPYWQVVQVTVRYERTQKQFESACQSGNQLRCTIVIKSTISMQTDVREIITNYAMQWQEHWLVAATRTLPSQANYLWHFPCQHQWMPIHLQFQNTKYSISKLIVSEIARNKRPKCAEMLFNAMRCVGCHRNASNAHKWNSGDGRSSMLARCLYTLHVFVLLFVASYQTHTHTTHAHTMDGTQLRGMQAETDNEKFLFGLNSCQMVWIFGRLWLIYYSIPILAHASDAIHVTRTELYRCHAQCTSAKQTKWTQKSFPNSRCCPMKFGIRQHCRPGGGCDCRISSMDNSIWYFPKSLVVRRDIFTGQANR